MNHKKKQYWGIGGAGIIFICPEDSTVYLQKRSHKVSGGRGQYGYPGGGIHIDDREEFHEVPISEEFVLNDNDSVFYKNAVLECQEECGSVPKHIVVDEFIYIDQGFKYKTFIVLLSLYEKEIWNPIPEGPSAWEIYQNPDGSYEQGWFSIDSFARLDLFFGFTPELLGKIIAYA